MSLFSGELSKNTSFFVCFVSCYLSHHDTRWNEVGIACCPPSGGGRGGLPYEQDGGARRKI